MSRKTSSSRSEHTDSELRIVLLGCKESGKSSAGNTIFGSDEFDVQKHAECVKKQGIVAGRQISVIDTPSRSKHAASVIPRLFVYEAARSVTLCPPGPHALMLVVNIADFIMEVDEDAVIEHLQMFGETVWKHVIVLFTNGDKLGKMDIQQHIEFEGESLKWLLEKCGNRFHIFNNKAKDDTTQVAELLKKIDEMVAGNHGNHFELDKEKLSFIAQKQREYEELKGSKAQKHIEYLKLLKGNERRLTKQRIILLGHESTSSTADTILNKDESKPQIYLKSINKEATVGRWQVTVVVTPDWLRNWTETSIRDKLEIVRGVSLCAPGPHAFLLVIPANKRFTETDEVAFNEHLELLGEKVWNYSIVLFTHVYWMGDTPIELYITSEGEPLNRILKKCGNRYHVLSNVSDDRIQVETLLEKIEVIAAGNSNTFYEMDEKNYKDMTDEGHEEPEVTTCSKYQLPSNDLEDILGQRKRKYKKSSGSGTVTPSECDSAKFSRPNY